MKMDDSYNNLKTRYRLPDALKAEQKEIIQGIMDKKHVLGVLLTGFGKSLTFTVPPLLANGVGLVISPLRALMQDQVASLRKMGVDAVALMGDDTSDDDVKAVKANRAQVIFITPEGLEHWTSVINTEEYRKRLVVITFDEVHMLPEWGDTFRQAYLNVGRLRSLFEDVPILMLTATLPENTLYRALHILSFTRDELTEVFRTPDRPNIKLFFKSNKGMELNGELEWYVQMLATQKQDTPKCIVYVNSSLSALGKQYAGVRSRLGDDAFVNNDRPSRQDLMVEVYTATLPSQDRQRVLMEFTKETSVIRCLFCTMAFGMGVDIPDVRYVVLWGAPSTIPDAWQQIGRAGRDGSPSEAYMLYTRTSLASQRVQADVRSLVRTVKDMDCLRHAILRRVCYREVSVEPITECCVNLSNDGCVFHGET